MASLAQVADCFQCLDTPGAAVRAGSRSGRTRGSAAVPVQEQSIKSSAATSHGMNSPVDSARRVPSSSIVRCDCRRVALGSVRSAACSRAADTRPGSVPELVPLKPVVVVVAVDYIPAAVVAAGCIPAAGCRVCFGRGLGQAPSTLSRRTVGRVDPVDQD